MRNSLHSKVDLTVQVLICACTAVALRLQAVEGLTLTQAACWHLGLRHQD